MASRHLDFPRDLAPHPDQEIEWWYLFGFFESCTLMACLWRYREPDHEDGMMVTWALTGINETGRRQGTFVDRNLLESMRERIRQIVATRREPVLETILEMTAGDRVFAPYSLADSSARRSSPDQPADLRVGTSRVSHDAASRRLTFEIEDGDLRLVADLDLSSTWFPMCGTGAFEIEGLRMAGYTHPQAPATLAVVSGGETGRLNGRAWFDHQWGQWCFEKPVERHYHPEWHYFSALLDDGKSLNIYGPQRSAPNGRIHHLVEFRQAVLCLPDGEVRIARQVNVTPRDRLESLHTHNMYEYGWTIEIPDFDCVLEFEPLHPDHEVFVFTIAHGILELGCRVSGTLGGVPCGGPGFVEAFGSSVDVNDFFWGQKKTALADQLERFMPRRFDAAWLQRICGSAEPLAVDPGAVERAVLAPIWSMMDRGGKGWRATWLTTCCHALGGGRWEEHVRDFLPIIELLHTGSLVIDDIQDGSSLRRGIATLHRQIGTPLAINVGNLLYFLPLLIIDEARWLSDSQRGRVYDVVLNALRQGHVGQALDLMFSNGRYDPEEKLRDFERTRRELLEQYRLKSGCQLEAIARIAGVLTGAPDRLVDAVADYSRSFGVAFQIVDDLIDVQEGREKLGKDPEEDLGNGKLNLVLLHALAACDETERGILVAALRSPSRELNRALPIREIVQRTGAIQRSMDEAEKVMEDAWGRLAALPPSDAKIVMRAVPLWLILERRRRAAEYDRPGAGTNHGRPSEEGRPVSSGVMVGAEPSDSVARRG